MPNPARPDGTRAATVPDGEAASGGVDEGPSSEVRLLEPSGPSRTLHLATRLRGADAEGALVTITDDAGVTHYEGSLLPDGSLRVLLHGMGDRGRVRVLLETARWHRQAIVIIASDVTEHAFA